MAGATKVLFAERISSDRPDSDSIEAQDIKLETRAAELRSQGRQIDVIGKAVDRSVSGDIDMAERPELGQWLTQEGRSQWDELWVTTQDRLSRNDMHFMSLVFKTIEWGKVLIVLDDPALDLTTPEGRAIAHVKAIGPHRELLRIKDRCKDSHERRRHTPRWHGGIPPYGYTTERVIWEGGKEGNVLVLDEYMTSVLHEVRRWLVEDDSETFHSCADRLNSRGEPTGKDMWRQRKKRPMKGTKWTGGNLKQLLTSPSNLGIKLDGRKPMYNRDGSPFIIAEPVFDTEEWDELQAAIKEREVVKTRKLGTSPLLGVTFCAKCGKSALQVVTNPQRPGGGNRYYRCMNNVKRCPGVIMRADDIEQIVEDSVLEKIGEADVPRKVWEAGADFTRELEDLDKMISRLRSDREAGLYDDDEEYFRSTMKGYMERRKELAKLPQKPSGWQYYDTGVTYRQAWEKANTQERRKILIDAGIKFFVNDSSHPWEVYVPEDIMERVRKAA
jgi:site-specific DNA recombinase